jgi:hypothetical protein
MKIRIISLIAALLCLTLAFTSCGKQTTDNFKPESFEFTARTSTEETASENGFVYVVLSDGSVMITEAFASGNVEIPSSLGGRKVTAIGDGAFFGIAGITSVTIPEGVESIGIYAFSDCTALESVSFPSSLWRIAPFAFDNTPWLAAQTDEFVTVGDGVLIAYNGTSRALTLPDSVRHLGGALAGREDLYSLTLGNGVLSISDMALSFCPNLTSINFGLSLVYVGEQAFSGSECITSLIFPDTLRFLGYQACLNCYGVKYVYLGKSLTELGDNAFEYCQAMRVVYVPKTLTSLKSSDFTDCMSLGLMLYGGSEEEFEAISTNDNILSFNNLNKVFNYSGGANE